MSIEASSTQENCSAKIEEQDVKEEKLCQIVNGNSVLSKAHQLSDDDNDDEEEEKVKGEGVCEEQETVCKKTNDVCEEQETVCKKTNDVCEEQETVCKKTNDVCEEQETVCKKTNDVCEEQNRVPGEDDSPEKEGGVDAVGAEVPSGEASTQSQDSNTSGIQKITWRVLCDYGAKCYRKNPDHKKEYCHPCDADYDTVFNSLPACPYGAGCYRKNKAHWQTHSHPPATPSTRPAKRKRKPATTSPAAAGSDLEDDYDSADSFLNDASSDDYQPTDSDSDTDVGDDGEDDDEPDAKRMKKEAKKFLREKK